MSDVNSIKGSGSSTWEFQLIEEGWHVLTVHDDIEVTEKDADDGTKKRTLRIPLTRGDGSPELSVFCPLGSNFGLRKIADILIATGVNKVIEKEKNLPSLSEDGWPASVLSSQAILMAAINKLPGKKFKGEIKHSTYTGKDGKDRQQANVVAIAAVENKAANKKPVADTEDGGW